MDTVKTIVARIEERLTNFIDQNKIDHSKFELKVEDLCKHVNHEIELLNNRVAIVEDKQIASDSEKRGMMGVWKAVAAVLSVTLTIIGILKYFNLF